VAKRERYLFVCTNSRPHGTPKGSCATRAAVELHAALKAEINARGMSGTQVRACTSSCLDVCWAGPAILVAPDNVVLGRVTTADVTSIVDALTKDALEHPLLIGADDYDAKTAGPSLPELPPTP
jgi:(2Fe-2S) ferredoxin